MLFQTGGMHMDKIRILICCGGGFSSSYMMKKVQNEIIERGWQDKVMIDYSPFDLSYRVKDQYDVVMCCPHLALSIPEYLEKHGKNVPIYILPGKMYGRMYLDDIYQDALDIIDGFRKTGQNPFYFPDEEHYMSSQRIHSYRHYHPEYFPN
jgi:PTS system cellobiose-specific IIB component